MTAPASTPFEGFVAGGVAVTLPAQLFTELLPVIDDPVELRVTLYAMPSHVSAARAASDAPRRWRRERRCCARSTHATRAAAAMVHGARRRDHT
jgi:hypothetical protein